MGSSPAAPRRSSFLPPVPSSERFNDDETACLPAVSAVGSFCFLPDFCYASLFRVVSVRHHPEQFSVIRGFTLLCVNGCCCRPSRARPSSDTTALISSSSSPMMRLRRYQRYRVFVSPKQSCQNTRTESMFYDSCGDFVSATHARGTREIVMSGNSPRILLNHILPTDPPRLIYRLADSSRRDFGKPRWMVF